MALSPCWPHVYLYSHTFSSLHLRMSVGEGSLAMYMGFKPTIIVQQVINSFSQRGANNSYHLLFFQLEWQLAWYLDPCCIDLDHPFLNLFLDHWNTPFMLLVHTAWTSTITIAVNFNSSNSSSSRTSCSGNINFNFSVLAGEGGSVGVGTMVSEWECLRWGLGEWVLDIVPFHIL